MARPHRRHRHRQELRIDASTTTRYHAGMRELQDRFDTRRLADRLDERLRAHARSPPTTARSSRAARCSSSPPPTPTAGPTARTRAATPGFVRVTGDDELAFPSYDGNGMFRSLGNVLVNPAVGLLFIDFEQPQAPARERHAPCIGHDDPLLAELHRRAARRAGARRAIFPNCPRYIHSHGRRSPSPYVPRAGCTTAGSGKWKRSRFPRRAAARRSGCAIYGRSSRCTPRPPTRRRRPSRGRRTTARRAGPPATICSASKPQNRRPSSSIVGTPNTPRAIARRWGARSSAFTSSLRRVAQGRQQRHAASRSGSSASRAAAPDVAQHRLARCAGSACRPLGAHASARRSSGSGLNGCCAGICSSMPWVASQATWRIGPGALGPDLGRALLAPCLSRPANSTGRYSTAY